MTIGQPYYEPTSSEEEPEEPAEEEDTGQPEETGDTSEQEAEDSPGTDLPEIDAESSSEPVKSGCSTASYNAGLAGLMITILALFRRKK